ncbi:hypothetical protein [Niabella sp.]|uniref:hypothetical protein n=1 Tax=Niabella sp. TaxID=1962976 RepID=UPI00262DDCFE|nr:hypothetical protein [Niabella sp.]
MKKISTVFLAVFLYSLPAMAAPHSGTTGNYWNTETGPCSNPYTIIRLYAGEGLLLKEIVFENRRLKMTGRRIRQLNHLALHLPAGAVNKEKVAAVLKIKPAAVSCIREINESGAVL